MENGSVGELEVAPLPEAGTAITEKPAEVNPVEHADGGTRAWLQVIGSVFTLFNVW